MKLRCLAIFFLTLTLLAGAQPRNMACEADERKALDSLNLRKLVKLREQAREIIRKRPKSIPGHYLMGYSLHHSEGDLPRAFFHLDKAKTLFVKKYGPLPSRERSPWGWYERTLLELEQVNGEMDKYEDQIETLDQYVRLAEHILGQKPPQALASYAWPLMKLGKEEEARKQLDKVSRNRDQMTRLIYLNTKGALEMETGNAQASYDAFKSLINEVRRYGWAQSATYLRNGGEAAASIGRFSEAEKLYLQATSYFDSYSYSNPWWDVTSLYINQGRFAEATEALKKTHQWSFNSQPFLAQQSWAANQHITAEMLLQLGFVEKALIIAERFVIRPDRQGGDSVHVDQWEAGNLLMFLAAAEARVQDLSEQLCWTKGLEWWKLLAAREKIKTEVAFAGARAAALAAKNDRIARSLRYSYAPGTIMVSNWHRPDLVRLYGPGTTAVALQELYERKYETASVELPYLQVIEGEVERQLGNEEEAVQLLGQAIENLPKSEALLRTRATAEVGKIYQAQGNRDKAMWAFLQVLNTAPGMIRFLDIELPVVIEYGGNSTLKKVAKMVHRSPRFRWTDHGLRLKLSTSGAALEARLTDKQGTVLSRSTVKVEDDLGAAARNLAAEIHRTSFAPKINLSQKDLTSLDGSNLSGTTRSDELTRDFLDPGKSGPRI